MAENPKIKKHVERLDTVINISQSIIDELWNDQMEKRLQSSPDSKELQS